MPIRGFFDFVKVVVEVAAQEYILHITLHHIIEDGWSFAVLLRELAAFYSGEKLAPLTVQYADFAVWEQKRFAAGSEDLEEGLKFWRQRLGSEIPVLVSF